MTARKYGLEALGRLPDKRARKRAFLVNDTWLKDKDILIKMLSEACPDFDIIETAIPSNIKIPEKYFQRWDLGIFYKKIKEFQENNKERDFIRYIGDVDSFVPLLGNMLFIDEKETLNAIGETQTAAYVSLAKSCNVNIWYLVGLVPNEKIAEYMEVCYRLCEIHPSGDFKWYKGTLASVLNHFYRFIENSYKNPKVDENECIEIANSIIAASHDTQNYTELS